jgi:hypothetical protein
MPATISWIRIFDSVALVVLGTAVADVIAIRYPPQLSFIPMSPGIPPGNSTTCTVNL